MHEEQPATIPKGIQQHHRLRALKEKHGLTWAQTGALVSLSVSSIMNMKTGKQRALTPERAAKLAELEAAETVEKPVKVSAPPPRSIEVPPAPKLEVPPAAPKPVVVTPDTVAMQALDILAARYREDVVFLLSIICRVNTIKFVRAIHSAPAAAVDDLRLNEGIRLHAFEEEEDTGPAASTVRKLIGAA